VLVDELGEAQGAGQSRGPAADDDHVGFHPRALDALEGFAEDQHSESLSPRMNAVSSQEE
jgi:hypothetical protein